MEENTEKKFNNKIKKKMDGKKSGRSKKYIIICVILSILVIAGVCIFSYFTKKPKTENVDSPFHTETVDPNPDANNPNGTKPIIVNENKTVKRKEDVYNFLVVGCDKKGLNTDVIMLCTFDTKNSNVSIVQIPRDSYVKLNNDGGRRINSVFSKGYLAAKREIPKMKIKAADVSDKKQLEEICKSDTVNITPENLKKYVNGTTDLETLSTMNGMNYMKGVLKDTFGIITDYTVYLDLEGFKNIINIIGGVEMDIPSDMNYDDPYQDLHIHLKKGNQTLDGDKAEQFIRFRTGYFNADIGRIDAQKLFMTALLKKVLSPSTIPNLPKILQEINKNVITNITLPDATYFGMSAISLDLANITMVTMQGVGTTYNGVSYFSLHKEANLELVNKYFNVYDTDIPAESINVFELVKSKNSEVVVSTAKDIENGNFKKPVSNAGGSPSKKNNAPKADPPKQQPTEQPKEEIKTPIVQEPNQQPTVDETPIEEKPIEPIEAPKNEEVLKEEIVPIPEPPNPNTETSETKNTEVNSEIIETPSTATEVVSEQ